MHLTVFLISGLNWAFEIGERKVFLHRHVTYRRVSGAALLTVVNRKAFVMYYEVDIVRSYVRAVHDHRRKHRVPGKEHFSFWKTKTSYKLFQITAVHNLFFQNQGVNTL